MNVGELIDILQKFDKNLPVVTYCPNEVASYNISLVHKSDVYNEFDNGEAVEICLDWLVLGEEL